MKYGELAKSLRRIYIVGDDGEEREYLLPRGVHINVQEGERVVAGDALEDLAERADMELSFGSSYGTTATAHSAAVKANDPSLLIAALLIANGANINGDSAFVQKAPLLQACRARNWSMVTLLIQKGARPDVAFPDGPDKGMTPLHYAVGYGRVAIVNLLISHKAPINAASAKYSTPLHMAVTSGHQDVARLLRQAGGHE